LGVYNGHDAGAALFDDYRMVSAVARERVTRLKGDGGRFPHEAVDECLRLPASGAGMSKSSRCRWVTIPADICAMATAAGGSK
jgi:predicted NodU family carbamoyl transferase